MKQKCRARPKPPPTLRTRAEARLRRHRPGLTPPSAAGLKRVVHELQVHQVELEMQNEELRQAQAQLALAHDRFKDLYDFAPVGYLTVDAKGVILEANLTAAKMLGTARQDLVDQKLSRFVARESQDALHLHHQAVFATGKPHTCELLLRLAAGPPVPAQLESVPCIGPDLRTSLSRMVLIDISERRRAEDRVRAVSGRLLRVQEDEHRRIARDLHDITGPSLVALSLHLQTLRRAIPRGQGRAGRVLQEALRLTTHCLQEVRTLSFLLHPPPLIELGLAAVAREFGAGFEQRSGIKVELDLAPIGKLKREVEIALFHIVREGLTNIHRHSGSRTAALRLWREADEVRLELADAGRGIPRPVLKALRTGRAPVGVGLSGMRERLQQLGGRLEIRRCNPGTALRAVVPLDGQTIAGRTTDRAAATIEPAKGVPTCG